MRGGATFCPMAAASPGRASRIAPPAAPHDHPLTRLYEHHATRVFGFCLKWLRSREEAEDAVQTTFLYALRGLQRGVVPTFESAWLLAIARNVCLSRTKAARRRSVETAEDPHTLANTVPAPPRSEELDELSAALNALTELQRRALLMREWQGLSYREIADELGLTQSAVETLLFRGRRSLAARLGADRRSLGIRCVRVDDNDVHDFERDGVGHDADSSGSRPPGAVARIQPSIAA
jgi:RNA polymerase sigma-70 factor, ECF subfamily